MIYDKIHHTVCKQKRSNMNYELTPLKAHISGLPYSVVFAFSNDGRLAFSYILMESAKKQVINWIIPVYVISSCARHDSPFMYSTAAHSYQSPVFLLTL